MARMLPSHEDEDNLLDWNNGVGEEQIGEPQVYHGYIKLIVAGIIIAAFLLLVWKLSRDSANKMLKINERVTLSSPSSASTSTPTPEPVAVPVSSTADNSVSDWYSSRSFTANRIKQIDVEQLAARKSKKKQKRKLAKSRSREVELHSSLLDSDNSDEDHDSNDDDDNNDNNEKRNDGGAVKDQRMAALKAITAGKPSFIYEDFLRGPVDVIADKVMGRVDLSPDITRSVTVDLVICYFELEKDYEDIDELLSDLNSFSSSGDIRSAFQEFKTQRTREYVRQKQIKLAERRAEMEKYYMKKPINTLYQGSYNPNAIGSASAINYGDRGSSSKSSINNNDNLISKRNDNKSTNDKVVDNVEDLARSASLTLAETIDAVIAWNSKLNGNGPTSFDDLRRGSVLDILLKRFIIDAALDDSRSRSSSSAGAMARLLAHLSATACDCDWVKFLACLQTIAVQVTQVDKLCRNDNRKSNKLEVVADRIAAALVVHIKALLCGDQLYSFFPEYDRTSQFAILNRCFIDTSLKSLDLKGLTAQTQETILLLRDQIHSNVKSLINTLNILDKNSYSSSSSSTISQSSRDTNSAAYIKAKRGNYYLVNDILSSFDSPISLDDLLKVKKATFDSPTATLTKASNSSISGLSNITDNLRSELDSVNGTLSQRKSELFKLQKMFNAVSSEVRLLESELKICNRHLSDINRRYDNDIELFVSACTDQSLSKRSKEIEDASIQLIDSLNEARQPKALSKGSINSKYTSSHLKDHLKNGFEVLLGDVIDYFVAEKLSLKRIFKEIKANDASISAFQKEIKVFTSLKMESSKSSETIEVSISALKSKNKSLEREVHNIQKKLSCAFLDYSLCSKAVANKTAISNTDTVKVSNDGANNESTDSTGPNTIRKEEMALFQEISQIVDLLHLNGSIVLHDLAFLSLLAPLKSSTSTSSTQESLDNIPNSIQFKSKSAAMKTLDTSVKYHVIAPTSPILEAVYDPRDSKHTRARLSSKAAAISSHSSSASQAPTTETAGEVVALDDNEFPVLSGASRATL